MAKWYRGSSEIVEGGWYWKYYRRSEFEFQPWQCIFATIPTIADDLDSEVMFYYGPINLPVPPFGHLVGVTAIDCDYDYIEEV